MDEVPLIDRIEGYIAAISLLILIIAVFFEVGLLIFAYVNADKVECNLLWCTFTSGDTMEIHNNFQNITKSITQESKCYINGERVNCSEIKAYEDKLGIGGYK